MCLTRFGILISDFTHSRASARITTKPPLTKNRHYHIIYIAKVFVVVKDGEKITIRKCPEAWGKYIIKIEGKIVWEGANPHEMFPSMIVENPGKNLSICWKRQREFLIV
jgi:hypothetical protein